METVCQVCGYQRKPTDEAPDWECPSCGRAYAKAAQLPPSPLVIYSNNPAADSANRLQGSPSYRREPAQIPLNKRGIVVGTLFSILILILPVLGDPSSASTVLLHGDVGVVAAIFCGLMLVVFVMRRVSARIDADDGKSLFVFAAAFFGLVFAVIFLGLAFSGHSAARTESRIQANGLRVMADVVRVYTGSCGKGSCSIYVEYAFTPPDQTKPVLGYARLGSRDSDAHVAYARSSKQVPVAYEVGHPEVSSLNFDDEVFLVNHGERDRHGMSQLGKLFLASFGLVLVVTALSLLLRTSNRSNVH